VSAASPAAGGPTVGTPAAGPVELDVARYWWLWIVTGIAWIIAALIVLQFDAASITTVGVIIGCMFLFAGVQQLMIGTLTGQPRWLSVTFGVLFLIAGFIGVFNPESTFAGFADILGFLFLCVGVFWTIQVFVSKPDNPVWWLGLITGVLMVILAFWTSGQFFIEKAYTLLVFAGIWGLMHGLGDIARAFAARSLRDA